MAAEAKQVDPAERSCSRCADDMEAVVLRAGVVWRCPSCRQLEI
jgi:ribosomal protein L37AE/L43A